MAGLCAQNLTIATTRFINFQRKWGPSKYLENFFIHKGRQKCEFRFHQPSMLDGNDTNFDLVLWYSDTDLIAEEKLQKIYEMTKTSASSLYQISQYLKKPNHMESVDVSSFLIENINLLTFMMIGYLTVILCIFILSKLMSHRLNVSDLLFLVESRLISMSSKFYAVPLLMALGLFFFINLNVISGLIKTEKVVVDTTQFLNSIDKINQTSRTLVVHYQGYEKIFYKLLKKKNEGNNNTIDILTKSANLGEKVKKDGIESLFFFYDRMQSFSNFHALILWSKTLPKSFHFLADKILYRNPTVYYEKLQSIPMRRGSHKKEFINRRNDQSFEHGLYQSAEEKMIEESRKAINEYTRIYESLDKYTEEHTTVSNVPFDNLKITFAAFFCVLILITLAFAIHHLYEARNIIIHHSSEARKIIQKLYRDLIEKFDNNTITITEIES